MLKRKISAFVVCLLMLTVFSAVSVFETSAVKNTDDYIINSTEGADTSVNGEIMGLLGDVNNDNRINIKDATSIQKKSAHLIEFDEVQDILADVDRNSKVNVKDATAIQKWVANLKVDLLINHIVYLPDAEQTTVPDTTCTGAEGNRSIIYRNLKTAQYPSVVSYDGTTGLLDLPEPEADGYVFTGWYTKSEGGERVDYIPAGSTQDFVLFARWDLVEYTITYIDAPIKATKFTIESEMLIENPEWYGLTFSHWTDSSGKLIQYTDDFGKNCVRLEKGTTGNIELCANWKLKENIAVESGNDNMMVVFDEENEKYHFIYELGDIKNVVLGSLGTRYKYPNQELVWEIEEVVGFEEGVANSVAKTVAQSVTKTDEWSEINEWVRANSKSVSQDASVSLGLGNEATLAKAAVELSLGYTSEQSDSRSQTTAVGGSVSVGSGKSNEVSSTVSYVKNKSTSIKISTSIPADSPEGSYNYAYTGSVSVFAIVTYDPALKNYYLDTYSVMDDEIEEVILYTPSVDSNLNIVSNSGLPYDISTEELLAEVDNSYYVRYDKNGGTGEMLTSVFSVDKEGTLSSCQFEREGFVFEGWAEKPDSGVKYQDGAKVSGLAQGDEYVTLYAVWKAIPYTVLWDDGAGYDISVVRTESPNSNHNAGELSVGDTVFYGDKLSVTYQERKGYTLSDIGLEEVTVTGNITSKEIYAVAKPITYTIKYNANDGTGLSLSSLCNYNESYKIQSNSFVRDGWLFLGWNTKADGSATEYSAGQEIINPTDTDGETIDLYAQWLKVKSTVVIDTTINRDINLSEGKSHIDVIYPGFSRSELKEKGYTKVDVNVNFSCMRTNLICHNPAQIEVFSYQDKALFYKRYSGVFPYGQTTESFAFSIPVDDLQTDGSFWIRWSTPDGKGSSSDGWWLAYTKIDMVAVK